VSVGNTPKQQPRRQGDERGGDEPSGARGHA
jgi:hypothetical protein